MGKKWIACCILLFVIKAACSQVNVSQPINALLHSQANISVNWRDRVFPIADTPYSKFPQRLLKTKHGLFLFVDGSGRLYKIPDNNKGAQLQRVDSTFYSGYNFGAFPFVYHDSIYTLGGYGLWRINGQLRVFVPHEYSWDIVPLNKEIPVLMQEEFHNMLWYNEQNAKLYIGYSMVRNQAVKHAALNESTFDYTVRFLDLKTKDWHDAGALNNYFKDKIALLRNIAFTPWGQLVSFGDKLLIIDYVNNRLLRIRENAEHVIRPVLFHYPTNNLFYCIDSTLYFGNVIENRLSSLPLHRSDFTDAGITVYTPPVSKTVKLLVWIVVACLIVLVLFFVWKRRKQPHVYKHSSTPGNNGVNHFPAKEPAIKLTKDEGLTNILPTRPVVPHFDERELLVIQLIFNNSQQSLPTTIEDLNAVLGLSKKSNDAQKSHRSIVLKSINTKYSIWQNTAEKLIESKKGETDKRTFTYTIAPEKAEIIAKQLNLEV